MMKGARMTFGYYGKLPFAGDFLRHGLSAAFVSGWDAWMQRTLLAARQTMGEAEWHRAYLCAPIWRFSIAPGLCGPLGAAGIMMPSLDRVGRRFPFCIAIATDLPPVAASLALQPVAARLETLALEMIDDDNSLAALRSRLEQISGLSPLPADATNLGRDIGSMWLTSAMDKQCAMLAPQLPVGPMQAAALFNSAAPYWRQAQLTKHEA